MLDGGAAIHHHRYAGVVRDPGGLPIHDAELHPETSGADLDGLASVRDDELGTPEDVDDIERTSRGGSLWERPECRDPEHVPLPGVDRDAVVALVDEVAEDAVRRPAGVRGGADDRDPPGRPKDLAGGLAVQDGDRAPALLEVEIGDRSRPLRLAPAGSFRRGFRLGFRRKISIVAQVADSRS